MYNSYFQVYLDQCMDLAKQLVFKSTLTAERMNQHEAAVYGADSHNDADPTTWRYYKHLAGEYHKNDPMIKVISMDTLELIDFTKETLKLHRATKKGYSYGTRNHELLVNRCRDREILINGILNPVDINLAIDANDWSILHYPKELVEDNEYSLIEHIQESTNGFVFQHYNDQLNITDDLYGATMIAIHAIDTYRAVVSQRLRMAKTNEAHSFHVKMYLLSHGLTDESIRHLTLKQSLFLYRNILYLDRHAGSNDNFDWLLERILTERAIPLMHYLMEHDISTLGTDPATTINTFSTFSVDVTEATEPNIQLYPTVQFKAVPLNYTEQQQDVLDVTVERLFDQEDHIAVDNPTVKTDTIAIANRLMRNSMQSVLSTKALESKMIDLSGATQYDFISLLLNHWMAYSFMDQYRGVVNIVNPRTGEVFPKRARDTFLVMYYCVVRGEGLNPDKIPQFLATQVLPLNPKSVAHHWNKVAPTQLNLSWVTDFLHLVPEPTGVLSTDGFYNQIRAYHTGLESQVHALTQVHGLFAHTEAKAIHVSQFQQLPFALDVTGQNWSDWLLSENLEIADLTDNELQQLGIDLMMEGTGLNLHNEVSVATIQRSMLAVMTQLSSYSVQFISQINDSRLQPLIFDAVRQSNLESASSGDLHEVTDGVRVLKVNLSGKETAGYALQDSSMERVNQAVWNTRAYLDLSDTLEVFGVTVTQTILDDLGGGVFTIPTTIQPTMNQTQLKNSFDLYKLLHE